MKRALALVLALMLALSVAGAFAEGVKDGRFAETRTITVEIFDRSNDGGTDPANNKFTDFIKKNMLEKYNVAVEYVKVPRWEEVATLNNLLAAGSAPDICYTYSYETIVTYAGMGGVIDLAEYVEEYDEYITDLVGLITEQNLLYDLDPNTGHLWAIEGRVFNGAGQTTFIREDWLEKLNLDMPTDIDSFHDALVAFRDNAQLLLGDEADQMIPMMVSSDASWYMIELSKSFIPNDITDKDWYVYGYDDRGIMREGFKDALRVINQWYNEGLLWNDFALYNTSEVTVVDNKFKAGYVGAFIQNVDAPYRNDAEAYQVNMQILRGEDAAFIPVATFKNDADVYKKFFTVPVDRKVFFPATNDEILASLMYINFISSQECLTYIQAGDVGVNHVVTENGALQILSAKAPDIYNSVNNIDYTMTCNGLHLGDEITPKSLALSYGGIDAKYIVAAYDLSAYDIRYLPAFNCGNIAAEEGMSTVLTEKRNVMLAKAITCTPEEFDSVYESYYADYLTSGGQAIIDERLAAWETAYGDDTMLGD